jgi:MSHA pilin protein MshD
MTLVELVITIVIIGIAVATLYSVMASLTGRSSDPLLEAQSLHLAESLMEELQSGPFEVLANVNSRTPQYRDGSAIEALSGYRVSAVVSDYNLGGEPGKRIDVDVTDPLGRSLRLTGYRASY